MAVVEVNELILAVITTDLTLVAGGAPIFKVKSAEEGQKMAVDLSSILNGMAHDVGNGVIIIVKH